MTQPDMPSAATRARYPADAGTRLLMVVLLAGVAGSLLTSSVNEDVNGRGVIAFAGAMFLLGTVIGTVLLYRDLRPSPTSQDWPRLHPNSGRRPARPPSTTPPYGGRPFGAACPLHVGPAPTSRRWGPAGSTPRAVRG